MKANPVDYFLIAVFLLIISLSVFVTLVEPTLNLPKLKDSNLPDFRFEGVDITHFNDGKLMWEIRAKSADVDNDDNRVVLKTTSGNIYSENGNVISFTTEKTHYYLNKSFMEHYSADLDFVVKEKKYHLFSKVLDWDSKSNQFLGKGGVILQHEGVHVSGDTFLAKLSEHKLYVKSRAKADFQVKK